MSKYIYKRMLLMIPVILGIIILIFTILELTPGDPARMILGPDARQEDVDQLRDDLGLNDPFLYRLGKYMLGLIKGDLGVSYRTGQPIASEIALRFPNTFTLAVFGISLAVLIGIPLGIFSAVKQYSIIDMTGQVLAMFLSSMPAFFVGMLLILAFALKLALFPVTGTESLKHFVLPSIAVAASTLAGYVRMTRSTMLEVIRQDYVRTARAKGVKESRIILKHCLRNALLPIITQVGMGFATVLGGSVTVETVFAISGMGTYVVAAVRGKDIPAVLGVIVIVALITCVVNLAVDIIYAYIDPRIKSVYTGRRI